VWYNEGVSPPLLRVCIIERVPNWGTYKRPPAGLQRFVEYGKKQE